MAKKTTNSNVALSSGRCNGKPHKIVLGVLLLIAGYLIVWPVGWFTFNHTFGVLLGLVGLKFLLWSCCSCCR